MSHPGILFYVKISDFPIIFGPTKSYEWLNIKGFIGFGE